MSVLYDAPGPRARRNARIVSVVVIVALLAVLGWLLWTFASPRITATGSVQPSLLDPSRWDIFRDLALWRGLASGLGNTLAMAGVAAVLAIAIGVLFSFLRTARLAIVRVPTTVVLEFFRGMPVLLMMLFILLVFSTGSYVAGVAALAIYNGAIIGEILRAGVAALPRGQREAGYTIGLTPLATRFLIEFPQAARNMLPIIIAQLVVLLKDTALAYVIGYPELLRYGVNNLPNYFGNRYFFSLFFVVLVIYLAVNLALSWLARYVAKRTAPGVPIFGRRNRGDGPRGGAAPIDPAAAATRVGMNAGAGTTGPI